MRWWASIAWLCVGWLGTAWAMPEPACGPEQSGWRPAPFRAGESPDLRFLNDAPAGRHGFLQARGDGLVFEDGTAARFWGANVVARAIFESSDAAIDQHALRLAQLGFNLVRLHHHDSGGWQRRTAVSKQPGQLLDPIAMRKLDRWIARLEQHGVYVWLDLHTGRVFEPSEGIPGFEELARAAKQGAKAKGFLYVNPRLQELVLGFAEAFLDHRNGLTGLRYRDDPAIAAVLVTNENDVSHHFGNLFAANKNNPWHRARFRAAASAFASRTKLPLDAVERTWEPGPSKLLLAQLEHEFDVVARKRLRAAGVRVPIALTSYWGRAGLYALAALSRGDLIDVHSYATGDVLRSDPRSGIGHLGWIAAAQLAGKPLTVSEWNHGKPLQRERYASPLWTAGIAALQGWDALMLYAYSQRRLDSPAAGLWSAVADPATIALMPAAAALYRRGDVGVARARVLLAPSRNDLFFRRGLPAQSRAIATLVEQRGVSLALPTTPELPWLHPTPASDSGPRVADLSRSFLAPGATRVASDTGEIERDLQRGVLRIDTPRSQVVVGSFPGREIALSFARLRVETSAAVAFTSLDGKPLAHSERVLVSVAARACPAGKKEGWRAEPVNGTAWLALEGARTLTPLDRSGPPVSLEKDERGLVVPLSFGGSWAMIEPAPRRAP